VTLPRWNALRRLPWWLAGLAGVLIVLLGLLLAVRPFRSVGLLVLLLGIGLLVAAVVEILRAPTAGRAGWWRAVLGIAGLGLGVVVLVDPGLTVLLLVILVGIVPVVSGLVDLVRALRPDAGVVERIAAGLLGLAGVLFGVGALAWPDVSVYVLGLLFGGWLVVVGVRIGLTAWWRRPRAAARPSRARRPVARLVGAVVVLLLAVGMTALGGRLAGTPIPDGFYRPPAAVPSAPGQLLKAEPFDRAIPAGSHAWRILYTTTRDDGVPAIASGLVVVPDGGVDHPVIAWAHGTTGVAVGCAPSLLDDPFVAGAMPDLDAVLDAGWAIVATDYIGLGADAPHPYLVGEAEGRSVLDAVRAAAQLADAPLGTQVAIWGHSQGGGAALWAGGLAASYAPELDIVGVAAMAPAANLPALVDLASTSAVASILGGFLLTGFAATYPDVRFDDYVRPQARIVVHAMAQRCFTDPSTLVSVLTAVAADQPVWSRDPSSGPLAERVAENVPTLPIAAPVLLAQGLADPLITPASQEEYVAARCAAGQAVDYRTYPGLDHMGLVTGDSTLLPQLLDWTAARFAGEAATPSC